MGFWNAANLLSLTRIPLALAVWKAPSTRSGVAITALAGLTDILDGRVARSKPGASHPSGIWLDPLCDKVFLLSALGAAARSRKPSRSVPLLIAARELAQVPSALRMITATRGRVRGLPFKAAPIGKITTTLQFAAIFALLVRHRWTKALSMTAGVAGTGAALYYHERARLASKHASHRSARSLSPARSDLSQLR
jgi:cardiolipin synthase (CMP-forming)